MDVRNHGIFKRNLHANLHFAAFWCRFGGWANILFPVFLLRAAENPPHRRDRHLCSQELVMGPRTWQEASENKTEVSRGDWERMGRGVSLRRVRERRIW